MKFKTYKNEILNEAISKSIPQWLKPTIIASFFYPTKWQNNYNNYDVKWYDKAFHDVRPRGGNDRADINAKKKDYMKHGIDLAKEFNRQNEFNGRSKLSWELADSDIDFSRANFHEVDASDKNKVKSVLSQPFTYIPFMLLDFGKGNERVYVPGFNDEEQITVDPSDSRTFGDLTQDEIADCAKKMCYVDKTEKGSTQSETRGVRNKFEYNKNYSDPLTSPRFKDIDSFNYFNNSRDELRRELDKSGYPVNPNKYKDILKINKAKNYASLLDNVYDRMLKIRSTLSSLIGVYKFDDGNEEYNLVSDAVDMFWDVSDKYKALLHRVENINNCSKYTPERKEQRLIELFVVNNNDDDYYGDYSPYQILNQRLTDLEDKLSGVTQQVIDW